MCPTDPDREGHEEAPAVQSLASYHRCVDRIRITRPAFRAKRGERLKQQERHGVTVENNNQIDYADLVLTRLGIKYLLIEVKWPGGLKWDRRGVEVALTRARIYADRQGVRCVGVSDGFM